MSENNSHLTSQPLAVLDAGFPGFGDVPSDISVRCLRLEADLEGLATNVLSAEEHSRRASMGSKSRQVQFALGRIALRSLLSEELNVPPSDVPLVIEQTGRLSLLNSAKSLSLAHSGHHALAAVSNTLSGVDVEVIRDKPAELLDYILGDQEKAHIKKLDLPDNQRLFVCWTLKEAVLKATGTGLRRSPKKVRLTIDPTSGTAQATDPDGKRWQAKYQVFQNTVFALAFAPDQ